MTRAIVQSDYYGNPTLSEAGLRAEVVKRAHAAGWKVFSLPMVRHYRPVKDAVGYPDLTLARHGEVRFLELKTDHGVLSDEQIAWMDALPRYYLIRPSGLYNGVLALVLK